MCVYIFTLADKWINMKDDSLSTVSRYVDVESFGTVPFNQTGIIPSFEIVDLKKNKGQTLEDLSRYLEISFEYTEWDFREELSQKFKKLDI